MGWANLIRASFFFCACVLVARPLFFSTAEPRPLILKLPDLACKDSASSSLLVMKVASCCAIGFEDEMGERSVC